MTTQLDAELILLRWDQASDEDRAAAARYGAAELGEALDQLEAEVPRVVELVCSGAARMRDFPYIRGACRVGEAAVSWRETYPEMNAEWEALGSRARIVITALLALDPAAPGPAGGPLPDSGPPARPSAS